MKKATARNDVQEIEIQKKFETIEVEGSNSDVYATLMEHEAANEKEEKFMKYLKEAISASVKNFKVFVCNPSIDENGKLQFVPGFQPAVGYPYKELKDLAEKNGLRLGNQFEYVLFLGTLINKLIAEGWSEADAWFSVCVDSKELGHYWNSSDAKRCKLECTGSRKNAGKCDLANTFKIVASVNKEYHFCVAGGNYDVFSHIHPLASWAHAIYEYEQRKDSVGWFVL